MHYSEEECTSSDNVELLIPLFRRVIIVATAIKKAHKESTPVLINLIQKTQLKDACVFKIEITLNSECLFECEETL